MLSANALADSSDAAAAIWWAGINKTVFVMPFAHSPLVAKQNIRYINEMYLVLVLLNVEAN